jgi:NADPH-dependent glutamate synthase beta subunit-like oxidoreductase/NAD-dependent dihydropyrimidine dehydrogenase PreA subunit
MRRNNMALRKKIVKLCEMIGGIAGMINKIDENSPEYYSLNCCVTDEMAEVALAMGLRKERTFQEIAKKCGKTVEETKRLAIELADLGVCKILHYETEDRCLIQIFAPGMLEMMVGATENVEKHPEIAKAFEEYTRLRISKMAPNLPLGYGMMRVIPIESAIDANSKAVPYERISYYLDKYDKYSVSACSCRRSRRLLGEGCGHLEDDMCVQLGKAAEYYAETGKARLITKEEALAIFKKAEENGLMHEMPNIDGPGETAAICNCCACSCFSLRIAAMFNSPDPIRSNYVAEVDPENCVGCGQCVENCPSNALKLGQKLCAKEEIVIKPAITSRDHSWGEDNWNIDYRTNRKDVVDTGTSPCKTACPAHIAVQGYIKLASQGKYREALELIKKENPFPAVCGRICPRKCESACTRGEIDDPIAIDEIKKFIADKDREKETRFVPKKNHDYGKPIAIVGAGPAGLSCAYYLAIDGYKVTVFEKQETLGGMLTLGIPSFRLEKEVVQSEIDILRELGVEFKTGIEVGKDISLKELRNQGFKGFYLAIGAQGGRKLGIEGEDAEGVITGIEFLRDINLHREVSLTGKVIVIGGGNVAIDVARTATRTKAAQVDMYCLESRQEMPALFEEIAEAEEENITIHNSWGPKRIVLEKGKVVGVEFIKCKQVFDEMHRFNPQYDETDTKIVKADRVLLSIGQSIEWGNLLDGSNVELNRNQTAIADGFTYQTKQSDIFVGGDVYTGPKFAIDAIAAGKQAAISLHRFVQPGQSLVLGRDRREYHEFDKDNIIVESYDRSQRQKVGHTQDNKLAFKDNRLTFTEKQMHTETERCLGCGATVVDEYMCLGCGLCTTKCQFDAIKLHKRYDVIAAPYEKLPMNVASYTIKRSTTIATRAIKDAIRRTPTVKQEQKNA